MQSVPAEYRDIKEWRELLARVRRLEQRQPQIPELSYTPDADSNINIWMTPAGALKVRTSDGTVHTIT